MRLIFDEEIKFLNKKLGINIPSKTAFMDRMIVKVQDDKGEWQSLYRIKAKDMGLFLVKDNLDKLKKCKFKTWDDLVYEHEEHLNIIEKESLEIINHGMNNYQNRRIIVPVSGGKDSAVVNYLVNKYTNGNHEIVFSNTTNETHHTYKYIKSNYPNSIIITPTEGFYPFVERTGFIPTRFGRACCTVQKEMPMIQQLPKDDKIVFFMGMRKDESLNRSTYDTDWKNHRWGNREWNGILPILEWKDIDVLLFMIYKDIPFNSIYTFGYGRCGCTNCCFRSDYELILNKYFLSTYHDRWQLILEKDFVNNKKSPVLNCSLVEYKNGAWKAGMVRNEPTEDIIKEFAIQQNLDIHIAKKYFNKKCICCNKKLKKDDVALSMKFYGRHIEKFKCTKHIAEEFKTDTKELKKRIEGFKNQGCNLF